MIDLLDLNAKIAIAYSLALIVALLIYIAFIKDAPVKDNKKKQK